MPDHDDPPRDATGDRAADRAGRRAGTAGRHGHRLGAAGRPGTAARPGPRLSILYRGPLASCDYDCPYCPFAKRRDTPEQLRADRAALERFTGWVAERDFELAILFTPWGEGLVRSWYRRAMVELSRMRQVTRVAIQTNLSTRTGWLADADLDTLALWATYHPGQVPYARFLGRCRELIALGVRFSVGVVGLRSTWRRPGGSAPTCPSRSTCGSTRPKAAATPTPRRPSGPRSIRSSTTAGTRTPAPGCRAVPGRA